MRKCLRRCVHGCPRVVLCHDRGPGRCSGVVCLVVGGCMVVVAVIHAMWCLRLGSWVSVGAVASVLAVVVVVGVCVCGALARTFASVV